MTTTPTPATLDDLLAVDVNGLSGEQLAVYISLIRGYKWYVHISTWGGGSAPVQTTRRLFLQHPERPEMPGYDLWDGKEAVKIAQDAYRWLERPDRDCAAAVQLLLEAATRFGLISLGMGEDEDGDRSTGCNVIDMKRIPLTGYDSTVDNQAIVREVSVSAFCLSICRAYLLAWQAEQRAEREREGAK